MKFRFSPDVDLPEIVKAPITREQLNAYAEASGDFNRIHLDDEEAKKAGLTGVIAHGMLSMAFMGEYVCDVIRDKGRLDSFSCRFKAMTFPGDVITVSGSIRHRLGDNILVVVETTNQKGEVTAVGQAEIVLEPGN